MKIMITTPARFPAAFAAAAYHESRGELRAIVSPAPSWRAAGLGVSRARKRGLAPLGAWNQGFHRWGPRALQSQHQIAFSAVFDEIASRLIGDVDVVNCWCSTALRTIRAAHARGIPAVLEVASAHVETQAAILREEFARFGDDIDHTVLTPRVIARTVREYEEADAIIATSRFVRRTLVESGVAASKISVIPYGVDPAFVALTRRAAHGDVPTVLFVGGCGLRKGTPYLLDAFKRVQTRATLRLVGRTNEELFSRLGGLPAGVAAVGSKTGAALAAEYANADVFVLPSVEDGWGLVVNEAMSAGLPVIVSDAAGSAEVVEDGVNGHVVPARDVDALSARLEMLLGDADLRARMGAAARATAQSRTWRTYGDERNELVYAPLLGAHKTKVSDAAAA